MKAKKEAMTKRAVQTTTAQSSASKARTAKRFEAMLERAQGYLGWTIARVPFDVHEAFPTMLRLRVKGTIAGMDGTSAFRTSLFPVKSLEDGVQEGAGAFFLLVNKAAQRGAGVGIGEMARFTLEADLEPRPADLPDALAALLDEEPGLREFYDSLSESWRREIGKWIVGVKSEAAQMSRCEQMAERLLSTMEAERELPPLIERAFRLRPKARAGWAKMTLTQRRQSLLAVFYYRTPESQQRRLDKVCDEAERRG